MDKSNELPVRPRSFGDLRKPQSEPVVQIGADPWGQAKPNPEIYTVADHHSDGVISYAKFYDIDKAVDLFETGRVYVDNGTLKGIQLFSPLGEVVDQTGTFNEVPHAD